MKIQMKKKIIVGFLLSFNSKLNHFDRNLNLNRKWLAGENRYGFDLFRSPWTFRPIYGQRILPNARTFVNVVQHLRDFGRFESAILAANEKIAF
jgi:hypothetical protein